MTRLRALIADDNVLTLRFFADALAILDVDCVTVENGADAAARAVQSRFDLLLLDARMPQLDGIGALRRVRATDGPSRDATAWATTAAVDGETHAALRAAGFAEVLVKPITIDRLRAIVMCEFVDAAAPPEHENEPLLADAAALAAAGGDAAIVTALRGLFADELDGLPDEIEQLARHQDRDGLRDRLHRLDASAGFCGAPAITRTSATVRSMLSSTAWPAAALDALLDACDRVRLALRG